MSEEREMEREGSDGRGEKGVKRVEEGERQGKGRGRGQYGV